MTMKKFYTIIAALLMGISGAWAGVTVTIVDGTNAPFDTYGTRNTSATPNTFTSNAASGKEGLVISAPVIDRATWWSTYCLGIKNSAAQTDESVTFTAPTGYVIKSISMTVQAISSNNSYDVTVNGETTRVTGASPKEYSNITVNASSFSFTINSVAESVNWLAVKSMTVTLGNEVAFDPNNVAGKTFTMKCARGYVYWNGSSMKGHKYNASKFAIVSYDNNTYLYDATNNAFVCHTTAATAGTNGNPALESNSDFSKIAKNISFGSTNIAAYPYYVQEDQFTNWFNMDGTPNVYLNRWTNFENGNGGNTYKIEVVDTDFDQTAAVAMLDAYFNPSATVTYAISDASGVIYTSEAFSTTVGATINSVPADLQRPYCTYNVTSATMVAGTNTVNATVTYNPPFTVSSSFNDATWYYATLRGKQLRADESHKDGSGRYQTNSTNERTDVYKWAFVGNAYNLAIMNKGAGSTKYLNANNNTAPSMMDATPASDIKARWIASPNSNGGFSFRNESGANLYINDAGSGGNIGLWNSGSGANDVGSNWVIAEVSASDKAVLAAAIATAQALVATPGVPGYPSAAAASTLSSAITTAQGVYDNPAGDYYAAYTTLNAAIATAKSAIVYTPRTDVYYTITSARGSMVYDANHDDSEDADGNKFLWYTTSLDNTNVNHLWGFIEQDGKYYMYNVGKQQFATVTTSGSYQLSDKGTWAFSDAPAYVTFDAGINNSVAAPNVRIRATVATTGTTYSMSISTNYIGPVITYDAQGDGGIPMLLAESSVPVDATVTAAMEAKVEDVTPYRNVLNALISECEDINVGSGIGQFSDAGNAFATALATAKAVSANENATKNEIQSAESNLETAKAALVINHPSAGFYRVKNVATDKYLYGTAASAYTSTDKYVFANGDNSSVATVIQLVENNGHLYMRNQGSEFGWVAQSSTGSGGVGYLRSAAFDKYVNWLPGNAAGQIAFAICFGNGTGDYASYLTQGIYAVDTQDNSVVRGSDYTAPSAQWIFEEVTSATVALNAIGSSYYATLCVPFAYTVSGANVYTLTNAGESALTMNAVTGTVAAGTPVMLVGTSDAATLTIGQGYANAPQDGTALTGIFFTADVPAANNYFLGRQKGEPGFYKYGGGDNLELKANRAYYAPTTSSTSFGFTLVANEDDDVTAIESALNGQSSVVNGQYFDLQGRKVENPVKGQIYILNGKKVLF